MSDSRFDKRLFHIEPHIINLLTEIDTMKGIFTTGMRVLPSVLLRMKKSVLVTSAGASTRIEGARLTDAEVEDILKNLTIKKFEDRDSQEVQGYLETLQNVFTGYQTLPLREGVISGLHKELLKYSTKDDIHRGDYKKQENIVGVMGDNGTIAQVIFETTPAWLTAKEMSELIEYTDEALVKKRFHPLLIIAHFIVGFLKIHPFQDGNGRLSRILTNLLLMRYGYHFTEIVSHEQIIERRKEEYYLALRKSQETFMTDTETIVPWLNFFLSVIHEQATSATKTLSKDTFESSLSGQQQKVWEYLQIHTATTPRDISADTGVPIATVRQALEVLLNYGKVQRNGNGRAVRYIKI